MPLPPHPFEGITAHHQGNPKPSEAAMRTAGAVVRLIIEHQDFPTDDEIAAIIDREMHQRELVEALEGIIAHCVHPDKAITAVMVDLSPIRTALKLAKEGA